MTVLAVCGPMGSNLKGFVDDCLRILNKDTVVTINCSKYSSKVELLEKIKAATTDVIVFGVEMLLEAEVFSQCDIRVFLDCEPSSCLINLVRGLELPNQTNDLNILFDSYFNTIKSQNELIRESAKKFDLIFPEKQDINLSAKLFIDEKEQKLISPRFNRANYSDKLNFFKPDYGFAISVDKEITMNSISGFKG